LVHPEDFARIGASLEPHLRGETARYACEHRLLHKENRWIWVHDAGQVTVRDANGKALRAAGIHLDITASKQAEAALRAQQEHLSALLAAMDDWVFVIDTSGRFADIHWPPAQPGCAWPDAADWAGRDYANLLPADLSEVISSAIVGLMADGMPRRQEFAWELNGQRRHFLATFSALMKGSPWPQGFLCVARDISELKHLEQRLREQAMTDALTGVTNRRSFYEAINSELARVLRFDSSASLLMLDLDHFKQVNDRFGHAGGDEVLRHFCHLAQQRLRSSDLLGRLGGEEFAILLPGTDLAGAARFAEELCSLVAATPGRCGKQIIPFTVSIGVTSLRPGDENCDASFARADQALYRAKEHGRNRVEVAAQ
jgi:diguanylate cyclase (GGDEF)-like protein